MSKSQQKRIAAMSDGKRFTVKLAGGQAFIVDTLLNARMGIYTTTPIDDPWAYAQQIADALNERMGAPSDQAPTTRAPLPPL
jgi:hypothetical protein